MNRDETIALFLQGREAWNAWAKQMLDERKALEDAGKWAAKEYLPEELQPQNGETKDWLENAKADFSRCAFLAKGDGQTTDAAGDEEGDNADGEPVKSIFLDGGKADFGGFVFPGDASFFSVVFNNRASFDGAAFKRDTNFVHATFRNDAFFDGAAFNNRASFAGALFSENALFVGVSFGGEVVFDDVQFSSDAFFPTAVFSRASFDGAEFSGDAYFYSAIFNEDAKFVSAAFRGHASFTDAAFSRDASFDDATFSSTAFFFSAVFLRNSIFKGAHLKKDAVFMLARFAKYASFKETVFEGPASFYAIRGESGFSMAGASFEKTPDFIQAHFEEAPRLDDLIVEGPVSENHPRPEREDEKLAWRVRIWREMRYQGGRARTMPRRKLAGVRQRLWRGDANIPARWRALKRLAVQGHDTERELEFNAREIRSQRFLTDWPLPFPFWRSSGWVGFFRFWSGLFYGLFSNYGRSLGQPLGFWAAAIAIAAVAYASQSPDLAAARAEVRAFGGSPLATTIGAAWFAWKTDMPCYQGEPKPQVKPEDLPPSIGALSQGVQSGTGIANEALHLAVRNAFIVLDGSSEAAHRTFGCLYGVELYGGSNPLAAVPSAVSSISAAQKLFSALMIFLFGLALRNMLKVK